MSSFKDFIYESKMLSIKDIKKHFAKTKEPLEVQDLDGNIYYIEGVDSIFDAEMVYGIDRNGEEYELKITKLKNINEI